MIGEVFTEVPLIDPLLVLPLITKGQLISVVGMDSVLPVYRADICVYTGVDAVEIGIPIHQAFCSEGSREELSPCRAGL